MSVEINVRQLPSMPDTDYALVIPGDEWNAPWISEQRAWNIDQMQEFGLACFKAGMAHAQSLANKEQSE